MLLGLDLGTTNVKALVTDLAGRAVGQGSCPVQLLRVGSGGVEQDIEEIWQATLAAIRQAVRSVEADAIQAIGISSQGGALQLLDAHGKPQGRVISWLDQRGRPFDDALSAELGRDWFVERIRHGRSGLAIGQLLRLRQEFPSVPHAASRVGFVGDVVVERLCGRGGHDATSCGLTLLYNPTLRTYDPDLLERLDLSHEQLPRLTSPREAAGGLRAEVARETGLRPGIPVSAAIHDQYAAALATGAVRPGGVMVGTGTAWVLLAVSEGLPLPVIDDAFVCSHVVEGLHGQIISLVNGGSAFAWALELTGQACENTDEIERLLEAAPPGCEGLQCWPFFTAFNPSGVAPGTRGRLSGLQLSHRPEHLLRAVVEGLAFELNRHLDYLRKADLPITRLVLGGGAAGSLVTAQVLADVTELSLDCGSVGAGSPLGAAIIARGLVEPATLLADLAGEMAPASRSLRPGPNAPFYQERYRQYLRSLPALDPNSP